MGFQSLTSHVVCVWAMVCIFAWSPIAFADREDASGVSQGSGACLIAMQPAGDYQEIRDKAIKKPL